MNVFFTQFAEMKMFSLLSLATVLLFGLMIGCANEAEISSYTTPKPEDVHAENHLAESERPERTAPAMTLPAQAEPAAKPARMYAAIVPNGDQNWFYKMTGPVESVGQIVPQLAEFVSSVTYNEGKPVWTLPEGWQEQPGNQFRYATLVVPVGDATQEFTVSALPASGDITTDVVININRWNGQLGLGEITTSDLEAAGEDPTAKLAKIKSGEQAIYSINIVGEQSSGGMGRPPFAR